MSAGDQFDDDLLTKYVLARRQRPDADEHQLAELIVSRLSDDQLLHYAGDALVWEPALTDRRELALRYVQNFVFAMETDPDDDPEQRPSSP
ncbi:MAG: hypothetical protein ACRDRZ_09090 [Pseudonocardiaceae bacterium]